MVLRVTFFALMALGLLGLGFIGYAATRPPPVTSSAPPPPVTARVLTAVKDIPAGALLKPGDLGSKEVPVASMPAGATMDNEDERRGLVGAMVRRSLGAGETIRAADALRPGDHGFLAAVLKGDMRAVTVSVDAMTSTAGLIWPGDRVDLILTQTIGDQSLPAGRRVVAEDRGLRHPRDRDRPAHGGRGGQRRTQPGRPHGDAGGQQERRPGGTGRHSSRAPVAERQARRQRA